MSMLVDLYVRRDDNGERTTLIESDAAFVEAKITGATPGEQLCAEFVFVTAEHEGHVQRNDEVDANGSLLMCVSVRVPRGGVRVVLAINGKRAAETSFRVGVQTGAFRQNCLHIHETAEPCVYDTILQRVGVSETQETSGLTAAAVADTIETLLQTIGAGIAFNCWNAKGEHIDRIDNVWDELRRRGIPLHDNEGGVCGLCHGSQQRPDGSVCGCVSVG